MAAEYLARHASLGSARAEQLITLLRDHWAKLASPPPIKEKRGYPTYTHTRPATRLEELWPGLQPDGPPADMIDLPRLHNPTAWWLPRNQPPPVHRPRQGRPSQQRMTLFIDRDHGEMSGPLCDPHEGILGGPPVSVGL